MAAEIVAAMRKDRLEIRVGRIKQLAVISRISDQPDVRGFDRRAGNWLT